MSLPLTTANLTAWEASSSKKSFKAKYIFRFGISKCTAYDYIFEEEKRSNLEYANRIGPKEFIYRRAFIGPVGAYEYLLYSPDFNPYAIVGCPTLPAEMTQLMNQATYERLVLKEVIRIRQEAQDKRIKLQSLIESCPYNSRVYSACFLMTSSKQSLEAIVSKLPLALCLVGMGISICFYLIMTLCLMFLFPYACLLDTIVPVQKSARDEWFLQLYKQYPDIDTFAIDTEVKHGLDLIAEKINAAYPQLTVDVGVGQDFHEIASYRDGSAHINKRTEYYDRFILQFQLSTTPPMIV
jgi:hypothetical protein